MNAATAAVLEALEAERLAPVPRSNRSVAVDVDDLALVLAQVSARVKRPKMPADAVAAYGRLESAVRRHAAPGSAP